MAGQPLCSLCRNADPLQFLTRIESESGPNREKLYFTVLFCSLCGQVRTKVPFDPESEENILLKESGPKRL
jgi:hypothetical protein